MKRAKRNTEGSITLEACISLILFVFLILLLYSFFIVFQAESKIADCLIRCGESLSLDVYASEKLTTDWKETSSVSDFFTYIALQATEESTMFYSDTSWYKGEKDEIGNDTATSSEMEEVLEERFIAYLVGDGENAKSRADDLLTNLRVVDGLEGIDFSESYVDSEGDLYIVVQYKLDYIFDFPGFGFEPIDMKQTSVSRLWQ